MTVRTIVARPFRLLVLLGGLGCALVFGCDGAWQETAPPPSVEQVRQLRTMRQPGLLPTRDADSESTASSELGGNDREKEDATSPSMEGASSSDGGSDSPAHSSGSSVESLELRPYAQWSLQETAADSLARIGAAAVPELMMALRHPSSQQRLAAASVLGRIGPDAAAAVPALVDRLNDIDPGVRRASARALGQIGPQASEAVPDLMKILNASP